MATMLRLTRIVPFFFFRCVLPATIDVVPFSVDEICALLNKLQAVRLIFEVLAQN